MKCTRARAAHPYFFMFAILVLIMMLPAAYADDVSVQASRNSISLSGTIDIYGVLQLGGMPVTNGLVAIQVLDSMKEVIVIRTTPTGSPPEPWKVRITSFLPCDSQGNPQSSFELGTLAHFKVEVENLDLIIERYVVISVNLFDQQGYPIGVSSVSLSMPKGKKFSYLASIPLPREATVGGAEAYANALTAWPKDDGHPYCSEVGAPFVISGGAGGSGSSQPAGMSTSGPAGSYGISFKIPVDAQLGSYRVYARARYGASATTTFDVFWLYTDMDRDGVVNIVDVTIAAQAFGSQIGDPGWSGIVDQNGDGTINIIDISLIALDFGRSRV